MKSTGKYRTNATKLYKKLKSKPQNNNKNLNCYK